MSDGADIKSVARQLSFPRYPGTDGDTRAIEWLANRMRDAGLETAVEPFSYDLRPADSVLRLGLLVGGVLVGLASLVDSPSLGLSILVIASLPGVMFLTWSPWLERLYSRDGATRTANVSGVRGSTSARLTLIVMAHHDSKSQTLSLPIRVGLTFIATAGALGLTVLQVARLFSHDEPLAAGMLEAIGPLTALAVLMLATMQSRNESPGGVDNAGSVAILLEIARRLPDLLPADARLVCLSTGAEEDHMIGARRWLDAHGDTLLHGPVFCLNLDGAGAPGRPVLIERFGFGRRFSHRMSAAARRCARELHLKPRGILMLPGIGIDTIPFAHRGIPSLTLSSGSLGRATMSVHSPRDVADHLDEKTLEEVTELAIATLVDLAETAGEVKRKG